MIFFIRLKSSFIHFFLFLFNAQRQWAHAPCVSLNADVITSSHFSQSEHEEREPRYQVCPLKNPRSSQDRIEFEGLAKTEVRFRKNVQAEELYLR